MILRPYQSAVVAEALDHLNEGKRVVVVLPTGAGKTVVASEIVRRFDRPTLWLAHRRELIAQARAVLPPGTVVDSVQRRSAFPAVDLVVIDEGHHSVAGSYVRHLAAHRGAVLHLTATPYRLDGKGIGEVADLALWVDWPADAIPSVAVGREGELTMTAALVREGVLIEPAYYSIPGVNLDGVGKARGDYETAGLVAAADKPSVLGDAVREYRAHALGRRAVAFCVNVEHAEHVAAAFLAAGIAAAVVSGKTPKAERDDILGRLRAGTISVVATVMVLTEGWDLPSLECLIVLRPTTSRCLWLQMVGRVMRTDEGKTGAVVLDHAGNTQRLGFATDPVLFDLDGRTTGAKMPSLSTCKYCYAVFPAGRADCPQCGKPLRDEEDQGQLPAFNGLGDDTRLVPLKAEDRRAAYVHDPAHWERLAAIHPRQRAASIYARERGDWPIVSADGRLLSPDTIEGKKRCYFDLLQLAKAKEYKPGFASHRYKSRFNAWPPREWFAKYEAWSNARA